MKKKIILGSVLALLVVALLFSFAWNIDTRRKLRTARHNIEAAQDSIRYFKAANGSLYAEKKSFISTIKELRDLNKELYDKVEDLKKRARRRPISAVDASIVIHDTIYQESSLKYTLGDLVNIHFADETIDAKSLIRIDADNLHLKQFTYQIDVPLEVYFTENYEVIARSPNSNVKFSKLNSFVDPSVLKRRKPKRWGLGLQAGVGATMSYNFKQKDFSWGVGPYVGVGLSYQILQW